MPDAVLPLPLAPTPTLARRHDRRLGGRALDVMAKTSSVTVSGGGRVLHLRMPPRCRSATPTAMPDAVLLAPTPTLTRRHDRRLGVEDKQELEGEDAEEKEKEKKNEELTF